MRLIARFIVLSQRLLRRLRMYLLRPLFKHHGRNFVFDPNGIYSWATISVGDDVYIGPEAVMSAVKGITIGNKVMMGPRVMFIGGNHNTSQLGTFMADVKEKRETDDLPIVVEDDVWIGAGAMIFKGVILGRGSIVAAGAVVTKSVPPYAIAAGIPARVLKWRWDEDEIQRHELGLYPPEKRLSRAALSRPGQALSTPSPP